MKSLDTDGRVIYLGSLSKTLAPGLRLGFVVAPEPVIRELRALRRMKIRHPPINNQRAAALFLSLGHYRAHISRLSASFKQRTSKVQEVLVKRAPGLNFNADAGNASIWVTGSGGLDSSMLAERAEKQGVLIEDGAIFFAKPNAPRNTFRLGISSIPEDRIERGLEVLAQCLNDMGEA